MTIRSVSSRWRLWVMLLTISAWTPGAAAGTIIDILLVYDTTATGWVSAQGGMTAFSQEAVNRMNQAMQNSDVDLTFRLAHAMSVNYTTTSGPSAPLSNDLSALQSGSGPLAEVHTARNTHGADLVAMLVDTGSAYGYVGVGYLLSAWSGSPNYGFTVNAVRSVAISHTLTHEVGHNLGAHHSKYQTASPGPNQWLDNQYSAGWYLTGTNAIRYHTIMSYNSDKGIYYQPAPLFSTPLRTFQGTPAGDALDGDNARLLRETKGAVASYRNALTPTCPHEDDLVLDDETVSGSVTHTACRTITAGPSFTVAATGDARLRAGERIELRPGFRVLAGGRFRTEIASELASQTASPTVALHPTTRGSMPAPLPASADVAPRTSAELLTWSLLPDGLRSRLSELEATVRDARQSAEGDSVVFSTEAALLAQDDNAYSDVYHYATETDTLSLLSADWHGRAGNRPSHTPRLDGSGRHVLYLSSADDLVAGPSNRFTQLYHADLLLETTTRLTETSTGRPGRGDTAQPLLAGEWAIYRTEAADLAPEGPGLYRQHLSEAHRQAVGLDLWGLPDPRARYPAADATGAQIAYQRPDVHEREQIHLNDGLTVERLGSDEDPVLGWLEHGYAALSPDGRYLAYRAQGTTGPARLHLLDRDYAETVSLPWPADPSLQAQPPRFSADGAELWWIAPEQGGDLPEVVYKLGNPLATAVTRH